MYLEPGVVGQLPGTDGSQRPGRSSTNLRMPPAVTYPEPGAVTLIAEMVPLSTAAVAVAPLPLPCASVMVTVGADV